MQPDYRVLEVKQLRDENQPILHYVGVVRVNINGTLTQVREVLNENESFMIKERFIFVTKKLKLIHPKNEHTITVNKVYRHSLQIKILHGTGEFNSLLFYFHWHFGNLLKVLVLYSLFKSKYFVSEIKKTTFQNLH